MRSAAALFAGLSSLAFVGAAAAQGAGAPQLVEGATAADLLGFFQAANVSAKDTTAPGDVSGSDPFRTLEVSMGQGATFYVAMRSCENGTAAARCGLIQPYVLFGSLNFPLGRINAFNYQTSALSTMMMTEDGALLLAAKFNMAGGVAKKNLFTNMTIFVTDIGRAVDAIQKGGTSGSTISYGAGDGQGLAVRAPENAKVNWIGKATPNIDPTAIETLKHVGAAQ